MENDKDNMCSDRTATSAGRKRGLDDTTGDLRDELLRCDESMTEFDDSWDSGAGDAEVDSVLYDDAFRMCDDDRANRTPEQPEESVPKFKFRLKITKANSRDFFEETRALCPYLHLAKLGYEWFAFVFEGMFQNEVYDGLSRIHRHLRDEKRVVCPRLEHIWNWAVDLTPETVAVVILGQDPYHTVSRNNANKSRGTAVMADGIAFSVTREYGATTRRLPASLVNIAKQAAPLTYATGRFEGNLRRWAAQGVLLLNTVMTTVEGVAYAHSSIGWEFVTDRVVQALNKKRRNLIFMLWGAKACAKSHLIREDRHVVFKSRHPSPLANIAPSSPSAVRSEALTVPTTEKDGWFANNHFQMANFYLKALGQPAINWSGMAERRAQPPLPRN